MTELNEKKREDLLARIRSLQAKTIENGCTEAEALAAAQMAIKLIDKFGFEQSDLELKSEPLTEDTFLGPNTRLYGSYYIASSVAEYCDVRVFTATQGDRKVIKVFGRESDCTMALYMLHLFATAFVYEWREYCKHARLSGTDLTGKRRQFKKSFDIGMASRLSERLKEMKQARNTQVDPNSNRTGNDLVIVKNAVVDEEYAKRYNVRPAKAAKAATEASAYFAGRDAAERVSINPGISSKGASLQIQ